MKKINYFIPAIIWGLIVLILMLIPGSYIPRVQTFADWLKWDKIVHLILFGVFGFVLLWGFYKSHFLSKSIYLLVFLILVLFGALTEFLQHALDLGRNGNIYDFFVNLLGSGLGCLFFYCKTKI